MSRHSKIELVKGLLRGETSIDALKEPIDLSKITTNEKYLLMTVIESAMAQNRELTSDEADCLEYYRLESLNGSKREAISNESDEKVIEWYRKLDLKNIHGVYTNENPFGLKISLNKKE